MKRKIIALLLFCFIGLIGCGRKETTSPSDIASSLTKSPTEGLTPTENAPTEEVYPTPTPLIWRSDDREYTVVRNDADKALYFDFETLNQAAELVVIGSFSDDATQVVKTTYSEEFGKDVIYNGISTNTFTIEQVLKGTPEGETIRISQRYVFDEEFGQLISFGDMTPMEKGSKWIYFLIYDPQEQVYYAAGDYTGRYPYRNIELSELEKESYTPAEIGLFSPYMFARIYTVYQKVLEFYQIVIE